MDLIESIDNLDRALTAVPSEALNPDDPEVGEANKDLVNLYTGLKMTEEILMGTLKKHGLEKFDPSETGGKFDPRIHDATFQTKVEGKEDGDVFHTQSKGYMLNGRVLRVSLCNLILTGNANDILRLQKLAWSKIHEETLHDTHLLLRYNQR